MGSLTRRIAGGNHTGVCVRLVYGPETQTMSGSWPISSARPPSLGVLSGHGSWAVVGRDPRPADPERSSARHSLWAGAVVALKGAPGCAGREGTYVLLKGHCDPQQQIESRTQSTTRIFTPGAWIISPYVSTRRNVETVTLRRRYPTSVKPLARGSRTVSHQGDWPRLASPPRR